MKPGILEIILDREDLLLNNISDINFENIDTEFIQTIVDICLENDNFFFNTKPFCI